MKTLLIVLLSLLVLGCSSPNVSNESYAISSGLLRADIKGGEFSHAIYLNRHKASPRWHIYIEGDGNPWSGRYAISPDPTTRMPLMLQMMVRDSAPAIYLGRPCYHGKVSEAPCKPWVWTHGRYSELVVASMAAALKKLIERNQIHELTLIGHSGGGTLVMLLAERIRQTRMLVTIAGNLDIDQWTSKHGYSPLTGSLNPSHRPSLPRSIAQYHFTGKQDTNISFEPMQRFLQNNPGVKHIQVEGAGHESGWEYHFCDLLQQIGSSCRPNQM